MTDRASFLLAVREDPDDLALRLVFADWLDERGDPLGEFIRVQCELEPVRDDYDSPRAEELRRRERELLRQHRASWLGDAALLDGLDYPYGGAFTFWRGLPDSAALPAHYFEEYGELLAGACPTLRKAVVFEARDNGGLLAGCEGLRHFRAVELADWVAVDDARALGASRHLEHLHSLTVWLGNRDQEAVCRAFAGGLPNLREMELVQWRGGLTAGESAPEQDERADALADLINEMLGTPAAHVRRPFDQRFPLRRQVSGGIWAGRLPRDRLAVAGVQYHGNYVTMGVLDSEGRQVGEEFRELRGVLKRKPEESWQRYNESEVLEYLHAEFGFTLDLIHVHEFGTEHGVSVYLYARHVLEFIESPDELPEYVTEDERREAGAALVGWVESGNFVVEFGNDNWADRRGVVHTT
jgi:uncharacterized protein (TIGR02996 family)